MSCTTPGKWLADCVCIIHLHAHSRNAAASLHCCSCCRASTSAVCARGLQVYTAAGGWQHVQLLHNQVAVFAGVVLQYATAGAIPAALHAYDAAEYQPVVRRTAAIGHLVIWYSSCCGAFCCACTRYGTITTDWSRAQPMCWPPILAGSQQPERVTCLQSASRCTCHRRSPQCSWLRARQQVVLHCRLHSMHGCSCVSETAPPQVHELGVVQYDIGTSYRWRH